MRKNILQTRNIGKNGRAGAFKRNFTVLSYLALLFLKFDGQSDHRPIWANCIKTVLYAVRKLK